MRYTLRNQEKIAKVYSPAILKRINDSLLDYFKSRQSIPNEDCFLNDGAKYQTLIINDSGHTTNLIAFYILGIQYDVVRLAFKEFIG